MLVTIFPKNYFQEKSFYIISSLGEYSGFVIASFISKWIEHNASNRNMEQTNFNH